MDFSEFGNVEFIKTFLALHYEKYDFYKNELNDDPRAYEYELILKDLKERLDTSFDLEELYLAYFNEAKRRGLDVMFYSKWMIDMDEFISFRDMMLHSPVYVREIDANNLLGDYAISYCDDLDIGFDLPVRAATKLLNEKGFITYWSSANKEDINKRYGHIVKDKNVAYILIDPSCLSDDLKELLFLDGDSKLWGAALTKYRENEKYYGIWAELVDNNVKCEDVSNELLRKALLLPTIRNEHIMGL